ncbi:granzyme A-like [Hyperolius riggenbachi]|uniref:granzyme A-like n=1 Tax=Hyperolius riggenbachi TaxID=752182 RepID=UPI0035A2B7BC
MRVFLPLFAATFTLFIHPYVCMKIVGGKEAIPHSRPYMAFIYTEGDYGGELCGGTLIDLSWVLTAAHCTINSSTIIELGLHSWAEEDEYAQQLKVLKWRTYHYREGTHDNDIQLVKLSGKATLSKAVEPLDLPTTFSDVKDGTICESAGWGATSNNEEDGTSEKLMEVSLPVISRERCGEIWSPRVITENMMCTLDVYGRKDTCFGDSGGPLICDGELRGVVSFGPETCAHPILPAVYAYLNEDNVNWIKRQMKKK